MALENAGMRRHINVAKPVFTAKAPRIGPFLSSANSLNCAVVMVSAANGAIVAPEFDSVR